MDYYQLENNREEILALLTERRRILEQFLCDLSRNSARPEGVIKSCRRKNSFQYYWKKEGADWKYLSKGERLVAKKIVNFEYRRNLIRQAEQELGWIDDALSNSKMPGLTKCFEQLSDARKALVERVMPTEEEAVRDFLATQYSPAEMHEESLQYKTSQGEFVRSKAEWMIAERLHRNGIPYQYEFPLKLKKLGMVRPDFRCLNVRKRKVFFWEHQGMMGDEEYAAHALRKIDAYEESGYFVGDNLIVTGESSEWPLTPSIIDRWIRKMLL